jgi:hypothetical protein
MGYSPSILISHPPAVIRAITVLLSALSAINLSPLRSVGLRPQVLVGRAVADAPVSGWAQRPLQKGLRSLIPTTNISKSK